MRVDGTHWHVNKDSCVITVNGQKGPKHLSLFIYIYINIRKKIEIFPENCYGNESNYCIWSTKSIQEKIFVCM